jgi:hypothetical protein
MRFVTGRGYTRIGADKNDLTLGCVAVGLLCGGGLLLWGLGLQVTGHNFFLPCFVVVGGWVRLDFWGGGGS